MIYTNDETDKSLRKKNFYLTVYVLPICITLGICSLIYFATTSNYLPKREAIYGYFLSFTTGLFLCAYNKKNWLKMPDGSYYNIKGHSSTTKFNSIEPKEYEAEYFYAKKEKVTSALIGFGLIGISLWLLFKSSKSILVPLGTIAMGIVLAYIGIKGILDKSPKLKLAKTGLWTAKLGFVDWNNVAKAQVVEQKNGKTPQMILEIYLKGTIFAEANQPDESLYLNEIDGKEFVEMVVDDLKSKRNELAN